MTQQIHKFEAAGLGKAPFKFAGVVRQDIRHGQAVVGNLNGFEVTTKPGGTCDFCGAYIVQMFQIESADGRRFKVGSDCVLKVGDAGLVPQVKKEIAKARKEKANARCRELVAIAESYLTRESVRAKLASNRKGYGTELSYVEFCFNFTGAGRAGRTRAAKIVIARAEELDRPTRPADDVSCADLIG